MIPSRVKTAAAPKLAHRNIPGVLFQLASRMRWDLAVMAGLCLMGLMLRMSPQQKDLVLMEEASLTVLGIAVSVFVAFRNTQAMNRWWEARILWGSIVNLSRHWRDTLRGLLGSQADAAATRQQLVALQALLCWLLNFELRGTWRRDARQGADALCSQLALPLGLGLQDGLMHKAELIGRLHRDGRINDWGRDALLRSSENFTYALGGLQRIRNSPIPATYDVFIRLICWFYGYAQFLNFANRGDVVEGLVLFLGFVTSERVGAYVENPFDQDGSSFCVPMDSICSTITGDLLGASDPLAQLPISRDPSQWS